MHVRSDWYPCRRKAWCPLLSQVCSWGLRRLLLLFKQQAVAGTRLPQDRALARQACSIQRLLYLLTPIH